MSLWNMYNKNARGLYLLEKKYIKSVILRSDEDYKRGKRLKNVGKFAMYMILSISFGFIWVTGLIQFKTNRKDVVWTETIFLNNNDNINIINNDMEVNLEYIVDSYLKCKAKTTREDCCKIFSDIEISELCTVNTMVERARRRKRSHISQLSVNSKGLNTNGVSSHEINDPMSKTEKTISFPGTIVFDDKYKMLPHDTLRNNENDVYNKTSHNVDTPFLLSKKDIFYLFGNKLYRDIIHKFDFEGDKSKNNNLRKYLSTKHVTTGSLNNTFKILDIKFKTSSSEMLPYHLKSYPHRFEGVPEYIGTDVGKPHENLSYPTKEENTTPNDTNSAIKNYTFSLCEVVPNKQEMIMSPQFEKSNETIENKDVKSAKIHDLKKVNSNAFETNSKMVTFMNTFKGVQTNQHIPLHPRIDYFYGPPYILIKPIEVKYLNTVPITFVYPISPIIYMQQMLLQPIYYIPNYFLQNSGQFSTSVVNNNITPIQGIEVRRENFNLQDSQDIKNNQQTSNITQLNVASCANNHRRCLDGYKCISKEQVCDNHVNCDDASDEISCSCISRVASIRKCDGFFDCPNGEDEQGCFGCSENEFNCNDWSKSRKSICIPLEHRCDNIRHCMVTGKDEEDCLVLTDRVGTQPQFRISNTIGFLHRNFKSKWYPTCLGAELWAMEICEIESGPSLIVPKIYMMFTSHAYNGSFINMLPGKKLHIDNSCFQNHAIFVECPPLYCGLRAIVKNPYRDRDTETNSEELSNEHGEYSKASDKALFKTNDSRVVNDYYSVLSTSRIVGGKPSQPAAWPWLISIYKNGIFHCGGVLINELWIVTAAHCIERYWKYYYEIEAGTLRRFSYSPMGQHRWITIIIPHKNYNKGILRHDIALMKVSAPIRYNKYVRPICLPTKATAGYYYLKEPLPGTICTTVGWGATIEHGYDPDHMREVEIPILNHCNELENQDGQDICAGLIEGGKDACQGDSGGPLMCRNRNNPRQWYLAGIVSHGEGCARPNQPGAYTRISKYLEWITENMDHVENMKRIPLQQCPGYVCEGVKKCLPYKQRCDKIVDCFFGDDEMNCDKFHNALQHLNKYQHAAFLRKNGFEDNLKKLPHMHQLHLKNN